MRVLSFHLCVEADENRIFNGTEPTPDDIRAIERADAVILPQGCQERLYRVVCRHCAHVFPDYDACFRYPGKTGQHALFREMRVPHPHTVSYAALADFGVAQEPPLPYPFVFKFCWGGEGQFVFLVKDREELNRCLTMAADWERRDRKGFLLQEYIPCGGRSLRVVVIGKYYYSYWRWVEDGGFYTNLAKGAVIDTAFSPDLQEKAVMSLQDFCTRTRINLAGFDFLFSTRDEDCPPLFLEINYCFRTRGIGGVDSYHRLLDQGIRSWLSGLGRRSGSVRAGKHVKLKRRGAGP